MPYIDRSRMSPPNRNRGAVLVVALILLLVLTLIGVTAARMQTAQEGMARNEDNHQLALQAAEAALRDGEALISLHSDADFLTDNNGLFDLASELQATTAASVADTIDWNANYPAPNPQAMTYTGPVLANAPASPVLTQVIIENLPPVARAGDPLCTPSNQTQSCAVYRVTAHAVGADASASATLQSIVH